MNSKVIILLVIFASVSGVLFLGFINHAGHGSCPINITGQNCLGTNSASHHISIFQQINSFIVSNNISTLILAVFLLIFFIVMFESERNIFIKTDRNYYREDNLIVSEINKIRAWYSIYNKKSIPLFIKSV